MQSVLITCPGLCSGLACIVSFNLSLSLFFFSDGLLIYFISKFFLEYSFTMSIYKAVLVSSVQGILNILSRPMWEKNLEKSVYMYMYNRFTSSHNV